MLCACIDIGSNTTRVLVADVVEGRLSEVLGRREFTRLGRELRATGTLAPASVRKVARVVGEQRKLAEAAGAEPLRVVATAAIRGAANRSELVAEVEKRAGLPVDVLDGEEEARLAFLGATATLPAPPDGTIGVVDVGGGSTEIALGTTAGGVSWSRSFPVGSGVLADGYGHGDPPAAVELQRMREHAAGAFDGLSLPSPATAVAVGGSATSLRRLVGAILDAESVSRGLQLLSAARAAEIAAAFGLAEERVRLLPSGLVLLSECSAVLRAPLQVGRGGLREGVCLELARGS